MPLIFFPWAFKMNSRLMFRPDLNECLLEDRPLMAIANFGIILLTTSGLSLVTPFPGASSSASGSLGSSSSGGGSSASVSGLPIPTSLYITGGGGISSLKPGNITGNPSTAAAAAAAGGVSLSIQVGSGADTAGGPTLNIVAGGATNNLVGLFTVADPTARTMFTFTGTMNNTSSTSSATTTTTGSTMQQAPPTGAMNMSPNGAGGMTNGTMGLNPQLGAPTLGPFNRGRSMTGPLPGSLVPVMPMLPGSN